jgi:hypothetical protein
MDAQLHAPTGCAIHPIHDAIGGQVRPFFPATIRAFTTRENPHPLGGSLAVKYDKNRTYTYNEKG